MFLLEEGKYTLKVLVLKPINTAGNGPLIASHSIFPFCRVQSTEKRACASMPQKTFITFNMLKIGIKEYSSTM